MHNNTQLDANTDYTKHLMDNGAYYTEAHTWYENYYLLPIVQRSWFFLISCFCGLLLIICCMTFINFMPLSKPAYVFQTVQHYDDMVQTQRLSRPNEPFDTAIQRLYVQEFVKRFAGYNAQTLQKDALLIRNYATSDMFNRYIATHSTQNSGSLPNIHGTSADIHTEISSIAITPAYADDAAERGEPTNIYNAFVNFTLIITTSTGVESKEQSAKLTFTYDSNLIPEGDALDIAMQFSPSVPESIDAENQGVLFQATDYTIITTNTDIKTP